MYNYIKNLSLIIIAALFLIGIMQYSFKKANSILTLIKKDPVYQQILELTEH